jgi:hypothetical protein
MSLVSKDLQAERDLRVERSLLLRHVTEAAFVYVDCAY